MSKPLPNNAFLQGIWQPWSAESDINDLVVIGEIPKELQGTFYRNGPNSQYVYSEHYHMFEGDGMIHAITFKQSQVSYQNRYIRTDRFLAERTARKSLFGGMRDFMARDESARNISHNTANTNVVWHHNQLLALNEGGQPAQLDVNDLTSCKTYTFNQVLDRSMTAHPKIDPITGDMLFYSYLTPMLDFVYYIANKKGQIIHQQKLNLPFLCLMHDFAITENYSIFPMFPLTWDFQRIANREMLFQWEPNLNTRFAIIPRFGKNEDVIWFEDTATLAMHVVNAREEEDKIILEMVVMDDIPENAVAFADDSITYVNYLTRWIFDLKTRKISKHRLDEMNMEFPQIDHRNTGRQYQHSFMNSTVNKALPTYFFDSITHYDMQNDKKSIHHFGDSSFALEPIFVPRSINAPEGDGFILSYVYRQAENRSDLVILDAQKIAEAPLAIVQLPHRVPYGFHGCWVAGS